MYTLTNTLLATKISTEKNAFIEVKEKLATGEKKKILSAFHSISIRPLSHKEKSQIFPLVLNLIGHDAIEVKCAAYSFVLRAVRGDSSILILAVNTILQEIKEDFTGKTPSSALRVSLAFDFISKISETEFLNHFYHEIERAYSSTSDIIRKSALLASPSIFKAFKETKIESIKGALQDGNPSVLGAAISAIISIEKHTKGTFSENELVQCFRLLCINRQKIEESHGNFVLLFIELTRILRGFNSAEFIELTTLVLEFLPLVALREVSNISKEHITPIIAEKIGRCIVTYIATSHKQDVLDSILVLLQNHSIKLEIDPFFINQEDTKKEKVLKLHILSLLNSEEGFAEISSFIRDKECVFHAIRLLLKIGILRDEHIRVGFRYCATSMLRAIYTEHPLPEKFSPVIKSHLSAMSNVFEKEAFLFLAGYYLNSIPDEAARIKRIRSSSSGVLYGKKEEREKPEEHLEEYLYFLLNMYTRDIISKEDCIQEAQNTFADEPFLFNKFTYLIDLPDRKHLLDLIAYKRVLYKITQIP